MHTGCQGDSYRRHTQDIFLTDVLAQARRLGPPDLILVTGDVANTGSAREFSEFDVFLNGLMNALGNETSNRHPVVVPVPGNHDLVRPTGRSARPYNILNGFRAGLSDNNIKLLHDDLWGSAREIEFFYPLFKNYLEWLDRIQALYLTHPNIAVYRSHFPGDLSVRFNFPEKPSLTIVGINGTWMHWSDGDYRGRMELWPEQLAAALGPFPRAAEETQAALLLMHHPVDWFSKQSRDVFDELIYDPQRFIACLHGHMHESTTTGVVHAGGHPRYFVQALSLFGLEHYGTPEMRRLVGYSWGELSATGELRIWPREYLIRANGAGDFAHDRRFYGDEIGGCVIRPSRQVSSSGFSSRRIPRRGPPHGGAPANHVAAESQLDTYSTWAKQKFNRLDLIGIGGSDILMSLDDVYVAARLSCGRMEADDHQAFQGESIALESIFVTVGSDRSVLLLGEPGSGKSTALAKLLLMCLDHGDVMERLGVLNGAIPIFLRLGRFTGELLSERDPMAQFVQRELSDLSGGLLQAGFVQRIWKRGKLLLLLDGLDEIPDEDLRTRVVGFLNGEQDSWRRRSIRSVVSCRRASYVGIKVRFSPDFQPVEVRPLDEERIAALVHRWFHHAYRFLGRSGSADVSDRLLRELEGASYGAQQVKVLVATPLMLTLLCLVVLRGGQIPRRRVDFYKECIQVLVQWWDQAKDSTAGESNPPACLDLTSALAVTRPLAWYLHTARRRDDLRRNEAANLIEDRLPGCNGFAVLDWLHQRVGLLRDTGEQRYGFVHFGFQEYLAASHVATERDAFITDLASQASDRWWREVVLLLAGQTDRSVFAALTQALLNDIGLPDRPELLRECLAEAIDPDLTSFVDKLQPGGDPDVQEVVLRLLIGRQDAVLYDAARTLIDAGVPRQVGDLAKQFLRKEDTTAKLYDIVIVSSADCGTIRGELARLLRRRGVRLWPAERPWLQAIEEIRKTTAAVAVIVASPQVPWDDCEVRDGLSLLARSGLPLAQVVGPDIQGPATAPNTPWKAAMVSWSDQVDTDLLSALSDPERLPEKVISDSAERAVTRAGEVIIVQTIKARMIKIPRGEFLMGSEGVNSREQPMHRVRISDYWLGEIQITNRQYNMFLQAGGYTEPLFWRDRRFSDPDQPVVGVNWDDAIAFCRWLSKELSSELRVSLPSEAQWEYAARGPDGRTYPWGDTPPTPAHACFGLSWDTDKPAPGGSFPAGRGPFGTLDQAGNVWEWCLDVWNESAYEQWRTTVATDPINKNGDQMWHALRGGAWFGSADLLRAANRRRDHAGYKDARIGFRIAVVRS